MFSPPVRLFSVVCQQDEDKNVEMISGQLGGRMRQGRKNVMFRRRSGQNVLHLFISFSEIFTDFQGNNSIIRHI